MSKTRLRGPEETLVDLLRAGYPLLYIISWEEDRVEKLAVRIARSLVKPPMKLLAWTVTSGLQEVGSETRDAARSDPDTLNPMGALERIIRSPEPAVYLLKDLHAFLGDDPVLVRQLKDAYYALKGSRRFVFIVSPQLLLPDDLRRVVQVVDFPLPGAAEIEPLVASAARRHLKVETLPRELVSRSVTALLGLTLNEAQHTLSRVFHNGRSDDPGAEGVMAFSQGCKSLDTQRLTMSSPRRGEGKRRPAGAWVCLYI